MDFSVTRSAQSRNRKSHGNPVIVSRVDLRPVQALVARNFQPIRLLGKLSSHGAEIFCDQGDAVGFLDAQLLCVANDKAIRGKGSDRGEHRKLVNDLPRERSPDRKRCSRSRATPVHQDAPNQFAKVLLDVQHLDAAPERSDHVQQRRTRGVHAERIEHEVGVGEEQRRAQKECRGRDIAGNGGVDSLELLPARNR